MKITDAQRKEVKKYIEKWRCILFLHQWHFDTAYHNDPERQGVKITMNTEYKDALIEINVHSFFIDEKDKTKREEIIVHELCHCIVQPLIGLACKAANGVNLTQQEIDWHKESVTQQFARAIYYYER